MLRITQKHQSNTTKLRIKWNFRWKNMLEKWPASYRKKIENTTQTKIQEEKKSIKGYWTKTKIIAGKIRKWRNLVCAGCIPVQFREQLNLKENSQYYTKKYFWGWNSTKTVLQRKKKLITQQRCRDFNPELLDCVVDC